MRPWEFWIDVGGTFTDCIARSPNDELVTLKVLSSGVTKGQVEETGGTDCFVDSSRCDDPVDFWSGYEIRFLDGEGNATHKARVTEFDCERGLFSIDPNAQSQIFTGTNYELVSDVEAPILAIRYVLGLRRDESHPEVSVRLGTTRGTNALLTRNGARTAFITTKGFGDVLLIGNQDRPRLFDLAIRKPQPLFVTVVEIDERIDSEGKSLKSPSEAVVRQQLVELKQSRIESIAICLLHSFTNSQHELLVERIARNVGFHEISTSSRVSPLIKIVSRGDTTVMDAYLNPILRDYMHSLRSFLGQNSLKIMTSAGGLVDADRFVGKDSILSGPAGGVIGFSKVAQRAGFDKSIGFDMGGTSTDVSRFDGTYDLEFETQKAGVRVVAPMLAIETVAAGGGSVCDFNGVHLAVGPESGGADPGPACYGRGGPLCVTDVNLYLGKILPAMFPFPLDRSVVECRLQSLCDQIAGSPMGKRYSPIELAEGFYKIANANMVRAIRKISVSKGYDPADYVLVTFGGAGAQHACSMARLLGIRQIIVHPYAGILSAYGMGQADVRRFGEQAVLQPYSTEQIEVLEPLFERLESRAREQVLAEGISDEHIRPPIRSLDLRYQGVEATINVIRPDDGDYALAYEELHQQLYGYTQSARAMEITAARVEVVGITANPPDETIDLVDRTPEAADIAETWFDGKRHTTSVFLREDLHPGDLITGPSIICEPTSTVVIDPGFSATVTNRSEILISDEMVRGLGSRFQRAAEKISLDAGLSILNISADPVKLEIFNNLFASIAEQMGVTLQKTSISTNVKDRLDFSCAIFDSTGELVVNAPHIPVHLGAMSETVKRILADNPEMASGDVFVMNDPYRGGSHLPDVTVVTPVHHCESNELLFFTASRAHHAEIGGVVSGSMPPFSKHLGEEGVLIRNFKFIDAGDSREAQLRELLVSAPYPTRAINDNLADLSAQVAANNSGVIQLTELVKRHTLPVVQAYMQHIQRAAIEKMRMALANISDGHYQMTDHLDDGSLIVVTITISNDSATVDFTGTGPVVASNLNANRAIVSAAVMYAFRCLIKEDIPLNSGVLEPINIILPECLLNPPERQDVTRCAAVAGGNVETSQRVVDTLLGALQVAAGSQGTMNNLTFGNETFGYYETICGGSGATSDADGADAVHTHMTNTRLTDVEVIERRYPVRIQEFSVRRGSGGMGRYCGGDGVMRKLEFLEPLKVSILSERRGPYPPFGLEGGQPGQCGRNSVRRFGSDVLEVLGGKGELDVQSGDVLMIETPGGGGFGVR